MKALIAGSTGMVGSLILENCIKSESIKEIVCLVRKKSKSTRPKVKEILVHDFSDFSLQSGHFQNTHLAFFCIGVYTGQVPDDQFKTITVDYALAFAEQLKQESPDANFCMLSGAGADRTEKSRTSFARYKGMAENQISAMGLNFYSFRPGYIYPVTPRKEPNVMYRISRFLYPMLKLMGKKFSITSTQLAAAMFKAGMNGTESEILENEDIIALLEQA